MSGYIYVNSLALLSNDNNSITLIFHNLTYKLHITLDKIVNRCDPSSSFNTIGNNLHNNFFICFANLKNPILTYTRINYLTSNYIKFITQYFGYNYNTTG